MVVIIDAGVPGMRNKVAVINPPLIAPTYMLMSRMKALMGSMLNVKGKVRAMSIAPVRPGIAPMVIPRIVPITTSIIPWMLNI
jgi:hypothetical protein